jgi:hypothetical protein
MEATIIELMSREQAVCQVAYATLVHVQPVACELNNQIQGSMMAVKGELFRFDHSGRNALDVRKSMQRLEH